MMKLLALTKYDHHGPSSRLRLFQYIPYLKDRGVSIQVEPLFYSTYLQELFSTGKRPLSAIISGYFKRCLALIKIQRYDLLWIEKELFPWIPLLEKVFLSKLKIPYIVDYDDAVFHLYDTHASRLVRFMLGNKIHSIMRNARIVTVGNAYLAQYARNVDARHVETIPTVVDISRYKKAVCSEKIFTVGWIGTPITEKYVEIIKPSLEALLQKANVRIVLVGASQKALSGLKREILPWSESTEVGNIQSFDVGIMPLLDSPFERGKCGYKLIQYMACGVPVIASPVGVNQFIVEHGTNGFLAGTIHEWIKYLELLRADQSIRIKLGKNARSKAENYFSLSQTAPVFYNLLLQAKHVPVKLV